MVIPDSSPSTCRQPRKQALFFVRQDYRDEPKGFHSFLRGNGLTRRILLHRPAAQCVLRRRRLILVALIARVLVAIGP